MAILIPASVKACNASIAIYLYNSAGQAVNVTADYTMHDTHVFDLNGNLIGTVDAQDDIDNANGDVIGYVVE